MTKLLLPYLKESKGVIMNLSSVAGKIYTPFMGAYSASKFALSTYSDTLRVELKRYDIAVCDLIVGRINTGFSSRAYGLINTPKTPMVATADKLAIKILDTYQKRDRVMIFPSWYSLFIIFGKIFPRLYDRLSVDKWREVID